MRFWSLHRHPDKPDLEQAEADLDRIRSNRSRVDELVDDLRREKHLNNFTANVTVTFQGGRR
jgi:hypothetical protein